MQGISEFSRASGANPLCSLGTSRTGLQTREFKLSRSCCSLGKTGRCSQAR